LINSDLLSPFGRLIRGARLQRDLTIVAAEKSMGIPKGRLNHYEMGLMVPGRRRAVLMAKFYGIPLEEFFDKMDQKENAK